jgi:hypothetical protein
VTAKAGDPRPSATARRTHSIWTTRRAVVAHVALAVWVPGCAVAAWWQVGIALSGDDLGWVYSVMWPCFAVFGVVFWWFLVHDDPDRLGARGLRRLQQAQSNGEGASEEARGLRYDGHAAAAATDDSRALVAPTAPMAPTGPTGPTGPMLPTDKELRLAQAEADDPELAEYNAYLASLAEQDRSPKS